MSEHTKDAFSETKEEQTQEQDFTGRYLVSYMVGIYLAINAIPDAFLLVEGPDCTYMKNIFIQGNQDYLSSLASVSGFHRIANTALHPSQIAVSREKTIQSMLTQMAEHDETGCVVLTSMPLAFITGADYDRLCKEVSQRTGKEILHVPGKSLSNDWLKAYDETLYAFAKQMTLFKTPSRDERNVALVGLLYDRNEEDSKGNIRELKRLLEGFGLQLVSVWFSGTKASELKRIQEAGTIISLPYGRRAAKILSARLDARLVETELPFGLTATERWIKKIGQAFSKEREAEEIIENELKNVVPKLEWLVPFLFQNGNFGYVGDPFLLPGFVEIVELFGGTVRYAAITNCKTHLKGLQDGNGEDILSRLRSKVDHILVEETSHKIRTFLHSFSGKCKISCVVTNTSGFDFVSGEQNAVVEFGFPSYHTHALYDSPYLAFNGFLSFVGRMANAMRLFDAANARR